MDYNNINKIKSVVVAASAVLFDDKVEVHCINQTADDDFHNTTIIASYTSNDFDDTVTFVMTKEALSNICDMINKKEIS